MGSAHQSQEPDPTYRGSKSDIANPHSQDNCSRRDSDRGSEVNPHKQRDHSTGVWNARHHEKRTSQENFWKLKQTRPDETSEKHYAKTIEYVEGDSDIQGGKK